MPKSANTFQPEWESLRNVPDLFWDSPSDYPQHHDVFGGVSEREYGDDRHEALDPNIRKTDREFRPLPGTPTFFFDRPGVIHRISEGAKKSDAFFVNSIWEAIGIDIEQALRDNYPFGTQEEQSKRLQSLTAKFGTEAFGAYLPWHAYGRSESTPWGMYLFLDKLIEWARLLHASGKYLPDPKPNLLRVFRLLWWLTYRHELFHFHVELFATRLESAIREPRYRPYVERIRSQVAGKPEWWEEALAQAVVLKSTMVKRILGLDSEYMKRYVIPYFKAFPEGYKRFDCEAVGGPPKAHRILSAQVARTQLHPVPTTDIAIAKLEYAVHPSRVPGYLLVRPALAEQFQLATPRLNEVIRYARRLGYDVDEKAPGDHKRITTNTGEKIQLNCGKHGSEVDLASIKAFAHHERKPVRELIRDIRDA